jgi:Outer membrane protein Omp28/Secretion system C-terminal sorting domain
MKKLFTLSLMLIAGLVSVKGQVVIMSQDFEAGSPPATWTDTQATPSAGWEYGNNLGSTYFAIGAHTRYACSNDDAHDDNSTTLNDASADYLISPVMNLTPYAATGVVLKFQYIQPGTYGSVGTVEVTTNGGTTWAVAGTVATTAAWAQGTINLSTYTTSATVQIAFRHNDGGLWADGFGIDDVEVKSVPALDASVIASTTPAFNAAGNITISGTLSNEGSTTLTSCTVTYSVDGGAGVAQNFTGLSVALGSTYNFSFTTPANVTVVGSHTLALTSSLPNGGADAVSGNNLNTSSFTVLSSIPVHNPVLEDHTGAWCQFCPDGAVVAEQVDANYPEAISTAVHNGDAMTIADGGTLQNEYISGYPGGMIDHFKFETEPAVELNRGAWDARMAERINMITPVAVSIETYSYNAGTREITVTVAANFVGPISGDLRFNCYVLEDSVTGTGTGYNQVNYYNTVSGHPYYGAGNPISGFVHRHVVRAMLGTAWGTASVIPGSVSDGDSYTNTYTYTLPAGYNENRISLVGIVQKYNADPNMREILNAEDVHMSLGTGINPSMGQINTIYPNPFSDVTNIEFNLENSGDVAVEIFDVFGKKVVTLSAGYMNAGMHNVRWNAADAQGTPVAGGVYMVVIKGQGNSVVGKVVVSK